MLNHKALSLVIVFGLLLAACSPAAQGGTGLKVVASTTLVGDVVRQVGGDQIRLTVLFAPGMDPHSYQPTPQDVVTLADADVIFLNGMELEAPLAPVIASANPKLPPVEVSAGVSPRVITPTEAAFIESIHAAEGGTSGHETGDPHVWTDPNNVMLWVDVIQKTLSERDPQHAALYASNAKAYMEQLTALDRWVKEQVAVIPPENRKLLSNHLTWGYFADRYGFEQVGAIIPSFSSMAEPSAQELARLEEAVRTSGVRAIFVENTLSPRLAERIAADTGIQLVPLLTDSLDSQKAPDYLDYIRYNVAAIVSALK